MAPASADELANRKIPSILHTACHAPRSKMVGATKCTSLRVPPGLFRARERSLSRYTPVRDGSDGPVNRSQGGSPREQVMGSLGGRDGELWHSARAVDSKNALGVLGPTCAGSFHLSTRREPRRETVVRPGLPELAWGGLSTAPNWRWDSSDEALH